MNIDPIKIQAELQELTEEKVKVNLDKRLEVACSIRQSDVRPQFRIRLNPLRIISPGQLEHQLNECREVVAN